MSAPDLTPNLNSGAQSPRSAAVDGTSAEQQPLGDVIETDRYLKSNAATSGTTRRGLVITKLRPPGSVGQPTCP